ncbi:type II toxin-antitoxin system VapC family toxin [Roseitranquillus sediminis]|uniref:type II toxin-antitoxin system VapC family toxin n=1 Tax=Roseitranquillus sediminis TaxID=2809051 RepID=UPI001D0C3A34|nr:type II toxin-antitoxin system VapC family toxin [Roseitranquillus sediminis]MBM9593899.1 type II toxin-antitoxin system VapC family toxin [Roseitranquillus sediminis]
MATLLLDTHAWVWSFADEGRLSPRARREIEGADAVCVSPISFFEIGQKVRIGRWPAMEPHAARLPGILREQGGTLAPLSPEICLHASLRDWDHRDPFDRLIASTAELLDMVLLSRDPVFGALAEVRARW